METDHHHVVDPQVVGSVVGGQEGQAYYPNKNSSCRILRLVRGRDGGYHHWQKNKQNEANKKYQRDLKLSRVARGVFVHDR